MRGLLSGRSEKEGECEKEPKSPNYKLKRAESISSERKRQDYRKQKETRMERGKDLDQESKTANLTPKLLGYLMTLTTCHFPIKIFQPPSPHVILYHPLCLEQPPIHIPLSSPSSKSGSLHPARTQFKSA